MRPLSLVVYDDSADTADVLAAVYEPRGIAVSRRRLNGRDDRARTAVEIVDDINQHRRDRVVIGRLISDSDEPRGLTGANVRRLSPLFAYGDLISAIDEFLAAKAA